ncbi:hypothetical protein J6590_055319 [Homalodisca vitripennis]|nr:hypothetical protein J6590_055319 [Homalodisca vitripennis]
MEGEGSGRWAVSLPLYIQLTFLLSTVLFRTNKCVQGYNDSVELTFIGSSIKGCEHNRYWTDPTALFCCGNFFQFRSSETFNNLLTKHGAQRWEKIPALHAIDEAVASGGGNGEV